MLTGKEKKKVLAAALRALMTQSKDDHLVETAGLLGVQFAEELTPEARRYIGMVWAAGRARIRDLVTEVLGSR